MSERIEVAAHNNAEWCDIMCRTHGIEGAFFENAWISTRRTPNLYPDAVTLKAGVSVDRLVAAVDTITPGCSIKDSFGDLLLESRRFQVLFDAEWIYLAASTLQEPVESTLRWSRVEDARTLGLWETAWSGEGSPPDLFRTDLLRHDAVAIFSAFDGDRIVAGAIANASDKAVAISNVFTLSEDLVNVWRGCLASVQAYFPDRPVVGYESGADLKAARACGFELIGGLRVWVAD